MSEMCQLSINISSDIAEELMSHLWLIPEIVTGCTCIPSQGSGSNQQYRNLQEKTRGATERNLILLILPLATVPLILSVKSFKFF